jgi:hypothetical protein
VEVEGSKIYLQGEVAHYQERKISFVETAAHDFKIESLMTI